MNALKVAHWILWIAFCAVVFALTDSFLAGFATCVMAYIFAFVKGLVDFGQLCVDIDMMKTAGANLLFAQAGKIAELEEEIATLKSV